MSRYNLIDEPWIPVRWHDGQRTELGICNALLKAKDISVIEDPSPLVTAALHRFLLAVLYRALEGPTDIKQAKEWFKSGISSEKIVAYLERWRNRFWLFDDEHPFGQIARFEPKIWRAWTVLAAEHNADNAKVLFDHIDVFRPDAVSASAAARWMLAAQTFSVSAGKSELSHTGTAPSATAVMVLPVGRDLEDTLLFCLVPQNRAVAAFDLPIWERDAESLDSLKSGVKRSIVGFADRYTWRTRSIRLQSTEANQVEKLAFASGVENASKDSVDPMLGYRIDDKKGRLPIQFRERGLWRDFDSLLPDDGHLAPSVIEHAAALTRFARERFPHSVMVLGQANNKAKIEYWRMERFSLPQALLGERATHIRTEIRQLLGDAEETQAALWQACRTFARNLLSRGNREPDKKDVSKFVEQMSANASYWSTLEAAFHDMLRSYTLEVDPDDIRLDWLKSVRGSLRDAWDQLVASVSTGDAWAIRALVTAEGTVSKKVKALDEEIQKYESHRKPQEETA
ncbi:type I-E CRISPR-associated protein Cse1/CasA [Acidithiobacillus ferridurans]|uniref:type I-E CRISPR-associated protein Cse1/CasA n=1 Tax=Acidithiobacillus ferridurans TaxID=1232575 RepID=UPI001C07B1D2|nr:type I-E CRISPR-associated protein Cse1/CasA [Acidithiobacillus ferridurans]MBU2805856.1 type I-E CRISPR-associated protein Cse1/CasA [Acidithiobacillus ferridurans]